MFINNTSSLKDQKLKHMAELQLSVVSDAESKRQIENQIQQWDENLERICCEQFRLRCYMASLQNGELPNPKVRIFFKPTLQQHLILSKIYYPNDSINNIYILGCTNTSDAHDKRNFESVGSVYRVFVSRIHLCEKPILVK